MTLDQFILKYSGQHARHRNGIDGQCMNVYRLYLDEVLKVPQSPLVSGAKDVWTKHRPEDLVRIPRSLITFPRKGDVVIWGAIPGNPWGHIGVCVSGGLTSMRVFDQNWPLIPAGRAGFPAKAKITTHNYGYVLGWLRPRKALPSTYWAIAASNANVRRQPNLSGALVKQPSGKTYLEPGERFQATGVVVGQNIRGNDRWVKSAKGNYCWSGNLRW
jgi:hypothetical protein